MPRGWRALGAAALAAAGLAKAANITDYVQLEMYGALTASDDPASPSNINLYDSAGLINFLLTQIVIETGKQALRPARQQNIEVIAKYTIRVRNPGNRGPDATTMGEYGKFAPFVFGTTSALDVLGQISQYGDMVGMQPHAVPVGDPRFPYPRTYYAFSLSGKCPDRADKDSPRCLQYRQGLVPEGESQYVRGGLCTPAATTTTSTLPTTSTQASTTAAPAPAPTPALEDQAAAGPTLRSLLEVGDDPAPTGQPGCVYSILKVETIKLDDLVDISAQDCGGHGCSSWSEFRKSCTNKTLQFDVPGPKRVVLCKEYDFTGCPDACTAGSQPCDTSTEVGIPFWLGRCDPQRNLQRVAALEGIFGGNNVDQHYDTNPPCSQYDPVCSKPIPEAGLAYCHRDQSGVCDQCYIPGTTNPPPASLLEHQVMCRYDLFNGRNPQYQDQYPQCQSDCSGDCSDATPQDQCCIYTGQCKAAWKASDWGECDAGCGAGRRTRTVSCPFEKLVGQCDESKRPVDTSDCRGNRCPWDPQSFGNWSACDNGCGKGKQTRDPACLCGEDSCSSADCEGTPKPPGASRPCFTPRDDQARGKGPEFCDQCPLQGGPCAQCLANFSVTGYGANCSASVRAVLATFRLAASDGPVLRGEEFTGVLAPALEAAVAAVSGVQAQVDYIAAESAEEAATALRGPAAAGARAAVVAACEDTDAAVDKVAKAFASIDAQTLQAKLLAELGTRCTGSCVVPAGLSLSSSEAPQPICPSGGRWVGGACLAPPTTTAVPPTTPAPSSGLPIAVYVAISLVVVLLLGAGGFVFFRSKQREQQRQQQLQLQRQGRRPLVS